VLPGVLPGSATFSRFGFSFDMVLSLSLRKHTGSYLRRREAKAACLRKASWVCPPARACGVPVHQPYQVLFATFLLAAVE
jgi:hypothetical protein